MNGSPAFSAGDLIGASGVAVAAELLMGRSSVTRYQRRAGEHQPELTVPTERAPTIEPEA